MEKKTRTNRGFSSTFGAFVGLLFRCTTPARSPLGEIVIPSWLLGKGGEQDHRKGKQMLQSHVSFSSETHRLTASLTLTARALVADLSPPALIGNGCTDPLPLEGVGEAPPLGEARARATKEEEERRRR